MRLSDNSGLASKNLFEWSQEDQGQDIVDIFDRAAFIQYKIKELEEKAAQELEQARLLLKDVVSSTCLTVSGPCLLQRAAPSDPE